MGEGVFWCGLVHCVGVCVVCVFMLCRKVRFESFIVPVVLWCSLLCKSSYLLLVATGLSFDSGWQECPIGAPESSHAHHDQQRSFHWTQVMAYFQDYPT